MVSLKRLATGGSVDNFAPNQRFRRPTWPDGVYVKAKEQHASSKYAPSIDVGNRTHHFHLKFDLYYYHNSLVSNWSPSIEDVLAHDWIFVELEDDHQVVIPKYPSTIEAINRANFQRKVLLSYYGC